MIKKLLAAGLIWFGLANTSNSQSILNPGFENNSSPPCAYNLDNASFNSYVSNVTAFGTYENCDIMSGSCGYGTPQQGNWFIGLSVPPGALTYDAIAVELSSPLVAGQSYQFSFYQKKDAGFDSNPLDIGYSSNNTSMGTPAASLPAVTSTSWTLTSVGFTPSFNASYITIRVAPSVYGWNHLDNMQLTNVTGVTEEKSNAAALKTFPNPASDKIAISFPATASENIIITIFSVTGEVIFEQKNISTVPITTYQIPIFNISNGIYFLSVQTEKVFFATKFVMQR